MPLKRVNDATTRYVSRERKCDGVVSRVVEFEDEINANRANSQPITGEIIPDKLDKAVSDE
jgi:hypothetical protein